MMCLPEECKKKYPAEYVSKITTDKLSSCYLIECALCVVTDATS